MIAFSLNAASQQHTAVHLPTLATMDLDEHQTEPFQQFSLRCAVAAARLAQKGMPFFVEVIAVATNAIQELHRKLGLPWFGVTGFSTPFDTCRPHQERAFHIHGTRPAGN